MVLTATELAETLRVLRERAKYTQDQLAEYLGLNASDISKIENGHKVPDALIYENWIWVCIHPPKIFNFIYQGRSGHYI